MNKRVGQILVLLVLTSCGDSGSSNRIVAAQYDQTGRSCADADADILADPQFYNDPEVDYLTLETSKVVVLYPADLTNCSFVWSYSITGREGDKLITQFNNDFTNISPTAANCSNVDSYRSSLNFEEYAFSLNATHQIVRRTLPLNNGTLRCRVFVKR